MEILQEKLQKYFHTENVFKKFLKQFSDYYIFSVNSKKFSKPFSDRNFLLFYTKILKTPLNVCKFL